MLLYNFTQKIIRLFFQEKNKHYKTYQYGRFYEDIVDGGNVIVCLEYTKRMRDGYFYYIEKGVLRYVTPARIMEMDISENLREDIEDHPEWFV